MDKVLSNDTIVESFPIIGICNKVMKSNLEIVTQVEYFTFSGEKLLLDDESGSGELFSDFIFWLAKVRSCRSKSLTEKIDFEDFNPKYDLKSAYWLPDYSWIFEDAFKEGFVKELVAARTVTEICRPDESTLPQDDSPLK